MKKILAMILCVCMLFAALPIHAEESEANAMRIYVSPSGNDNNNGTKDSPVKSLLVARDMARECEKNVEIIIFGGEYCIAETLTLDSRDSNTRWTNYENETPVITSAKKITGWSLHNSEKNINKAKVEEGFITRQVYFNGEKAKRSRSISYDGGYNNLDRTCELGLRSRNSREFYFYKDEVKNWNNFEDVSGRRADFVAQSAVQNRKSDERRHGCALPQGD